MFGVYYINILYSSTTGIAIFGNVRKSVLYRYSDSTYDNLFSLIPTNQI